MDGLDQHCKKHLDLRSTASPKVAMSSRIHPSFVEQSGELCVYVGYVQWGQSFADYGTSKIKSMSVKKPMAKEDQQGLDEE